MGSGGVAIAALPTVICLKASFSDGLGGLKNPFPIACGKRERRHDNRMNKESYKACLDILKKQSEQSSQFVFQHIGGNSTNTLVLDFISN